MPVEVECKNCKKQQLVSPSRAKTYIACSVNCLSIIRKQLTGTNTNCTQCSKDFHLKPSQKQRYHRTHGYFCSAKCYGLWKSINTKRQNNPNFRNVMYDTDGKRIIWSATYGRIKLHHAITFEYLEINKIPKGFCVHHRDCNHLNNDPENLVFLKNSNHRWLHAQFGNATLWAFYNKKIDLNTLVSWSNNKRKARRLLPLNLLVQRKSGVFKFRELLENPVEDNQQPSLNGNIFEGSTTRSES